MNAAASQTACVVALVGIAVLHQTRKTSNQSAHVSQAEKASEPNSAAAYNGVLNSPVLVQNILDFVGPVQHLYIAAINSLFNQCYAQVRAAEFDGFDAEHTNIRVLVGACTTRLSRHSTRQSSKAARVAAASTARAVTGGNASATATPGGAGECVLCLYTTLLITKTLLCSTVCVLSASVLSCGNKYAIGSHRKRNQSQCSMLTHACPSLSLFVLCAAITIVHQQARLPTTSATTATPTPAPATAAAAEPPTSALYQQAVREGRQWQLPSTDFTAGQRAMWQDMG
eukprot:11459-Heterococcus_DN1.PRE.5